MNAFRKAFSREARRVGTLALAAIMTCNLSFPQVAFATVRVDETELDHFANGKL